MSDPVAQALRLATRAHAGQLRKLDRQPYITHPLAVAALVRDYGYDDPLVAAALLHDTVEDTALTLAEIASACGAAVAAIVAGCTEIDGSWEARKREMIARLATAALPVKVVAAADKLDNVRHLPPASGAGVGAWSRFKRGVAAQAWYYRAVARSIRANVPDIDAHPLFAALDRAVVAQFGPSLPPDPA